MFELLLMASATIGAAASALAYKYQMRIRPLVKRVELLLAADGWQVWPGQPSRDGRDPGPILYNPILGIVIYFEQIVDEKYEYVPVSFKIANMPVRQKLLKGERRLLRKAMHMQSERLLLDNEIRLLETNL